MKALLPHGLHPEVVVALADAKVPLSRVTQGLGGAPASRGYHLADGHLAGVPYTVAVDISTLGLTRAQVAQVLKQLHQAGFAAWHRVPGADGWPDSEHDHIHAVYQHLPMKPSLQQQVADWHAGLNGLRDNRMTQEDRREVLDEYGPGAFLEPSRLAWPIHDQAHAAHAIAFMRMGRGDWHKFAGYLDRIKQRFPRGKSTAGLWEKIQRLEQSWGRSNPRLSAGHSPSEFDQGELQRGIQVELEHTDDPAEATRIAMDHLMEHSHYYSTLDRVFPHERHNRWNGRPSREELEARAYRQMLNWVGSYLEVTPMTAAALARLAIRDPLAPITRATAYDPYAHLPPGHWGVPELRPRSEADITQDMINFLVEARETGHVVSAPRGASPETARWKLR